MPWPVLPDRLPWRPLSGACAVSRYIFSPAEECLAWNHILGSNIREDALEPPATSLPLAVAPPLLTHITSDLPFNLPLIGQLSCPLWVKFFLPMLLDSIHSGTGLSKFTATAHEGLVSGHSIPHCPTDSCPSLGHRARLLSTASPGTRLTPDHITLLLAVPWCSTLFWMAF